MLHIILRNAHIYFVILDAVYNLSTSLFLLRLIEINHTLRLVPYANEHSKDFPPLSMEEFRTFGDFDFCH